MISTSSFSPISSSAKQQTLAVDLFPNGVKFSLAGPQGVCTLGLPLYRNLRREVAPGDYRRVVGSPLACLETLLAAAEKTAPAEQLSIFIGAFCDPFAPTSSSIDVTLNILERLSVRAYHHIYIQTRSPLVICAAPILSSVRERLSVMIAVETASDSLSRRLSPTLSLPTERLRVARSLLTCGVDTILRVAPIVPRQSPQSRLSSLAAAIELAGCPVEIIPTSTVIPKQSFLENPARSLLAERHLLENAHLALAHEIKTKYPSISFFERSRENTPERAEAA